MNKHQEQFLLYRIRVLKDEKAFAKLYSEYYSALFRFLTIKLPESEVEDALSTIFVRLWNYITGSRVENVSGLSFTIARGVIAEYYRKNQNKMERTGLPLQETKEPTEKQGDKLIVRGVEIALVKRAIAQLDTGNRTAIILRYLEDLPIKEVARRLQKTETATRTYLHRAIKILKNQIDQEIK